MTSTELLGINDLPKPPIPVPGEDIDYERHAENMDELKEDIEYARTRWKQKGGHIVLEGSFMIDGDEEFPDLRCESDKHPIVIRCKSIGAATIKGKGQLTFKNIENVWLYGINFENETDNEKDSVALKGAHKCRIARCDFHPSLAETDNDEKYHYLRISYNNDDEDNEDDGDIIRESDSNLIDHNKFHDKKRSEGSFLVIGGSEEHHICKHTVIEYNHFINQRYIKEGGEALRVGVRPLGPKSFKSLVRNNLFEKCDGDVECISNKSSYNTYSHNTFRNNRGALTFRHGDNNKAIENYFVDGKRGVRIFGIKEIIRNNYFENIPNSSDNNNDEDNEDGGLAPILVGNGDGDSYTKVKRSLIEKNIVKRINNNTSKSIVSIGSDDGNEEPEDNDSKNNVMIVDKGKIFTFKNDDAREGFDFKNNTVFAEDKEKLEGLNHLSVEECRVREIDNLEDAISIIKAEMPDIKILTALEAKDVGPSSGLSSYTLQDVVQALSIKETLPDDNQ